MVCYIKIIKFVFGMKANYKFIIFIICGLLPVILTGCSKKTQTNDESGERLVAVGDSVLYLDDVLRQIPSGLNPIDSISLINSIVENWLKGMIMKDIAASNIDNFDKINKLTEEYRNNLIIEQYLKSKEEEIGDISDADIKSYHEIHKETLKLSYPLIKGIFIKISDSDESYQSIKKWIFNGDSPSIDNIERYGLKGAAQYELFKDHWIDWNEIANEIPYRFYDADAFLESTKNFETSYGGWTYLLHIYDYTPSGANIPEEYASKFISEILRKEKITLLRKNLLISLYKQGIKDNIIKPGIYDPIKSEIRQLPQKQK